MLIIFKSDITPEQLENVRERVLAEGCEAHVVRGVYRVTINVLGDDSKLDPEELKSYEGVTEVISVMNPYQLVSRDFHKQDTEIKVKDVIFGPGRFVVMAGPCAVENEEQTMRIARAVRKAGANVLRGGAYKPRSSPYNFQGMGEEGLKILKRASVETGMPIITEALDSRSLEQVYKYGDIIQIGTRNMQNFSLLKEVGRLDKPVMLKRGMSSTIDEWLMAAEYVMAGGNTRILLCERGIRSFDARHTRNVVDLSAVPVVKALSHLPVVIDPSHGTGRRDSILPMSLASVAVGAHAVMIDVHDDAQHALCDGAQAITPVDFEKIMEDIRKVARALDKTVEVPR
ncbi:MAG: 3-deoxy-7-phosphoheptulonate synthase [Oligoflexia bacterium]|nr:3-deoxy-7-phosphoheptulonate synthase [Oligoflexia bacterium]